MGDAFVSFAGIPEAVADMSIHSKQLKTGIGKVWLLQATQKRIVGGADRVRRIVEEKSNTAAVFESRRTNDSFSNASL